MPNIGRDPDPRGVPQVKKTKKERAVATEPRAEASNIRYNVYYYGASSSAVYGRIPFYNAGSSAGVSVPNIGRDPCRNGIPGTDSPPGTVARPRGPRPQCDTDPCPICGSLTGDLYECRDCHEIHCSDCGSLVPEAEADECPFCRGTDIEGMEFSDHDDDDEDDE